MLFKEIIAFYSENRIKPMNILTARVKCTVNECYIMWYIEASRCSEWFNMTGRQRGIVAASISVLLQQTASAWGDPV